MKISKLSTPLLLIAIMSSLFTSNLLAVSTEGSAAAKPKIEIAILLDTSGSMSGLISQAKTHLWKIVNEFAKAERDGVKPQLQVALYEYGNDRLPGAEGYTRMIVPLTDDLDKLSEELFKLTTNGGSEYCGYAINQAADELQWSEEKDNLRLVFIAGNEPFTQGSLDYKDACTKAINKGITVNTIFCGPNKTGVATMWKDGADLAEGSYVSIDHNQVATHIPAPQDDELNRLSKEINRTYVAFGSIEFRIESTARQEAQDNNAASMENASERALTKSSHLYCNDSWDLVDACNNRKIDLKNVKKESLPDVMQNMSFEEKTAYIEKLTADRKAISEKIKSLSDARDKFIAEQRAKIASGDKDSLDTAIIKLVREQAESKNFTMNK